MVLWAWHAASLVKEAVTPAHLRVFLRFFPAVRVNLSQQVLEATIV